MKRLRVLYTHDRLKKTLNLAQHQKDISILITISVLLTIIGLVFIFEASSVEAFRSFGDSFYFFKQQLVWSVIGIGALIFFSYFDYRKLYYFAIPALGATLIFLLLVLVPGVGIKVAGARRWINLGFMSFQPTELAKFASILYLTSWLVKKEKKRFLPFITLLGLVIGLIMLQPDMGTAIIIAAIFLIVYYIAGESIMHLLLLVPGGIGAIILLIKTSPYRLRRLTAFLDPTSDPQGITYHINQILISLSSGGIFGRGISESRQKYQFLPEAHTDSIFAIIGEEVGFVGGAIIIMLYFVMFTAMARIAMRTKDRYGQLLVGAVFGMMFMQVIINLGGLVALIPMTGVPLPFISYGGSSLVILFSLIGIVINIAKSVRS